MKYNLRSIVNISEAHIEIGHKTLFQDVNIEIVEGELCYLVGRTGVGKSSILKTLYGQLPLKSGKGSVLGYDLRNLRSSEIPELRRRMGMIFQDYELFEDWTVYQNLDFVLRATDWKSASERNKRIIELLNVTSLTDAREAMVYNLSGGEKQRVMIARALLNKPELILADEPTGHLDEDTSDEILQEILTLVKELKTAIIISTHNQKIIDSYPGRVYKCGDKVVTEEFMI